MADMGKSGDPNLPLSQSEESANRDMIIGLTVPACAALLLVIIVIIACRVFRKYKCIDCHDRNSRMYRCAIYCNDHWCAHYDRQNEDEHYANVFITRSSSDS